MQGSGAGPLERYTQDLLASVTRFGSDTCSLSPFFAFFSIQYVCSRLDSMTSISIQFQSNTYSICTVDLVARQKSIGWEQLATLSKASFQGKLHQIRPIFEA